VPRPIVGFRLGCCRLPARVTLPPLQFPRAIRKSVARKLLVTVGVPSFLLAAAGLAWLRTETNQLAPGFWRAVAAGAVLVGAGMVAIHFVSVNLIVKKPLRALARAVRGSRVVEGLARVPVQGDDEIAQLAESFNTSLQAITDLRVQRTDDALAMAAMQRELKLNAELEEQHRLLDKANRELAGRFRELEILAGLTHKLNATLDVQMLCDAVTDAVAQQLGFEGFALLLADEKNGDLVVRAALGTDARATGSARARRGSPRERSSSCSCATCTATRAPPCAPGCRRAPARSSRPPWSTRASAWASSTSGGRAPTRSPRRTSGSSARWRTRPRWRSRTPGSTSARWPSRSPTRSPAC